MPTGTGAAEPVPNINASFVSGSSNQAFQGQGQQVGGTVSNNTYTPGQQQLQDASLNTLLSTVQSGQLPGNYGMDQAAFDALNANLTNYVNPRLASQFGAGSPVIGSVMAQANQQLAGQLSQQRWGNFNNLFSDAAAFTFTPVGNESVNQAEQQQQGQQMSNWQSNNTGIGGLLSILRGIVGF